MKNLIPWRYTPWLLRGMRNPLLLLAGLAALVLLPRVQGLDPAAVKGFFPYFLDAACFGAALFVTRGMVSGDLRSGYYRLLFSRPVHPGGYYLLRWLLGWAAVLLFAAVLTAGTAWKFTVALPFWQYAWYVSLQYWALGGLVFLLSVLGLEDAGGAVLLAALGAWYYGSDSPPLLLKLTGWLLPPLHLCRAAKAADYAGLHYLAAVYGLLVTAAAVAAAELRRFGEGGRGD